MADVTYKLTGFKELGDKLKEFGPRLARNGMRATAFAGAKVIRDAAKQSHPAFRTRTGTLEANIIVVRSRSGSNAYKETYKVTVRQGKRQKYSNTRLNRRLRRVGKKFAPEGKAYYGRFLEFGTSKMRAHPFLRPAFFNNVDNALTAMKARLKKAVDDAAAK